MKRLSFSLLIVVTLVLALGSAAIVRAGSSANYAVQADTVAAGAQTAASANYTITSTAGQPAIGQGASAS